MFVYHSMVEDEPRRTAVDVSLRAPDPEMPHLSWLAVPLASQRGDGFTPEEGGVLDALTERRFFINLTQSHSVTELTTDHFIVSLASRADLHDGVYDGWGAVTVLPG